MRELDIEHLTHKSIVGVAQYLEPYIRGWINYYGKFRLWEMNPVFQWAEKTACNVGTETVQALQNEHQPGLCLAEKSERTISDTILPLEGRIHVMKRIDLYNKSRMS